MNPGDTIISIGDKNALRKLGRIVALAGAERYEAAG
jgi:K+/H+ antiporter YhaU regulatory subunit KhtT